MWEKVENSAQIRRNAISHVSALLYCRQLWDLTWTKPSWYEGLWSWECRCRCRCHWRSQCVFLNWCYGRQLILFYCFLYKLHWLLKYMTPLCGLEMRWHAHVSHYISVNTVTYSKAYTLALRCLALEVNQTLALMNGSNVSRQRWLE